MSAIYNLLGLAAMAQWGYGQEGAAFVSLGEAVDAAALSWRTGPNGPWFGHMLYEHDGTDAARSGGEETGTPSWIETTVTGPALVSFWARTQSGTFTATVDGAMAWETFENSWTTAGVRVQPGVHTLRWSRLLQPYYSTENGSASFLDEVSVAPLTAVTPGEALDAPVAVSGWRSAGGLVFGVADPAELPAAGGDYLVVRSPAGSSLEADFTGPARVSFRWRTLAGTGNLTAGTDQARTLQFSPAAAGAWRESVVDIPPGPRVLQIRTAAGEGDLLMDAVTVSLTPATGAALDSGGLLWNGDWVTRHHASAIGGSVAASGIMGNTPVNPLTTSVTGPAEVKVVSALLFGSSTGWSASGAVPVTLNGVVTGLTKQLAEGWFQTTVFIPEGTHELGLRPTTTNQSGLSVESVVDQVSVTPHSACALTAALEGLPGAAATATGAGASRWRAFQTVTGARNGSAAVCGPLAAGGTEDLNVSVTGPGTLLFSLRAEALPALTDATLAVLMDGTPAAVLPATAAISTLVFNPNLTPWRVRQVTVPAGEHTVVFRASAGTTASGGQTLFWLDSMAMLANDSGPSALGIATGFSDAVWTRAKTGSGKGWQKLTTPAAGEDGQYAACPGPMALGDTAEMTAAFAGPGTLHFRWSRSDAATLTCLVDDVEQVLAENQGDGAGAAASLLIPPGQHRVSWKLVRTTGIDGTDHPANPLIGWVDEVSLTGLPTATGTLADALDATSGTATTSPVWPWQHRPVHFSPATPPGGPADGAAAFVEVPLSGESWMELPVQGPGRFEFWWRSENSNDGKLSLQVDGVTVETKQGYDSELWQRMEVTLANEAHTLRWQVASGYTGPENQTALTVASARRFWITGWQALPEVPLAEALDAPAFPWSIGSSAVPGSAPGVGWSGISPGDAGSGFSDDAAFTKSSRPLTTAVTGPGMVTFQWTVSPAPLIEVRQPRPPPVLSVAAGGGYYFVGAIDSQSYYTPPAGSASFAVDGVEAARLHFAANATTPLSTALRTVRVPVGPGSHTLTWLRPAEAGTQRLVVDRFAFASQNPAPLASELGLPAESVQFTGGPEWTVQSAVTHDGAGALQSGTAAAGESSGFQILIDGPGELTYWWRGDLGTDNEAVATASAQMKGPLVDWNGTGFPWGGLNVGSPDSRTTDFPWEQRRVSFGLGRHRMSWSLLQKSGPPRRLWLDEVVFTPAAISSGPAAAAEALDSSGLTWTTSPAWQRYQIKLNDSPTDDVLAGPMLAAADEAWVQTTVTGPAKLQFWWNAAEWTTLSGTPYLKAPDILMDGTALPAATYSTRSQQFEVPAGTHIVRLRFGGIAGAVYRPLLDRVRISTSLGEALDQPSLTWMGSWAGWASAEEPERADVVGTVHADSFTGFTNLKTNAAGTAFRFAVRRNFAMPEGVLASYYQNRIPRLRAFIDGLVRWDSAGLTGDWTTITLPLSGAAQTIGWEYTPSGFEPEGQNHFLLDQVEILTNPQPALPTLAEALETPGRTWSGPWLPTRQTSNPAHDDFASADPNTNAAPLATNVTGPGWMQFDYRTGTTDLVWGLDGATTRFAASTSDPMPLWLRSPRVFIPRGSHLLEWRTQTNFSWGTNNVLPSLDAFVFEPVTEIPVADGLDGNLSWTTSGGSANASWHGIPLPDAVGGDAVAVTAHSSAAVLQTSVSGPCMVEVRWRVEGINSYNGPTLQLNASGAQHFPPRSEGTWTVSSCLLPAGVHQVGITSVGYVSPAAFTLLVDHFTAVPSPTLAAALNLPGVQLGSQGTVTARQFADGRADILLAASPSQTNLTILSAEITGPGELVFDFKDQTSNFSSQIRRFTVDGLEAGDWAFSRAPTARLALSAGPHTLRWIAGSAAVSVGAVTWTPGLPSWSNGLWSSASGVTAWLTGSDGPWTAAPGEGLPGFPDAVKSVPGTYGWIQPVLSGSGIFTVWERTAKESYNQSSQTVSMVVGDWNFRRELQPAGSRARSWRIEPGTINWLAGFDFSPAAGVPLAEALDGSGLTWITTPPGSWLGIAAPATEGTSAAQAIPPVSGSPSILKTSVNGPGTLRYSWRTAGSPMAEFAASFFLNGSSASLALSAGQWKNVERWIGGSGPQELKWQADRIPDGVSLWVDAVHFTPANPGSLIDGLDLPGAVWTTGGTAAWTGLTNVPGTTGGGLAALNALGANGEAWVETTVNGSGELRFRWGFPDSSHGALEWELDGIVRSRLQTDTVWENEFHALPPGNHTLRWRYRTLENQTAGTGAAWLDAVSFTPGLPAANWGAAAGQPALTWSGGGSTLWNHGSSVPLQATLGSAQRHINASAVIPGPAWVDFRTSRNNLNVSLQLDGLPTVMLPVPLPTPGGPPSYPPSNSAGAGLFFVPPGNHVATWEFARTWTSTQPETASLQNVNVTPVTAVSLPEALDLPTLPFTTDNTLPWTGLTNTTAEGDDYAWLGLQPGQQSSLNFTTASPGQLSITWEATAVGTQFSPAIGLSVNGTRMIGSLASQTSTVTIGPGTHRITGENPDYNTAAAGLRIYAVAFTSWNTVPLDEAVGAPGRSFTTGGTGWWTGLVSPALAQEGNSLIYGQPTSAGYDDSTWLETTVTGPAEVSFWWRVENNSTSTSLTFGTARPGSTKLNPYAYPTAPVSSGNHFVTLGSGNHVLRWTLSGTTSPLQLDRLRITPRDRLTLDVAADLPGTAFTPGHGDWAGVVDPGALSGSGLIEVRSLTTGSADLEMTAPFTGPGVLKFSWRRPSATNGVNSLVVLVDQQTAATLNSGTAWEQATVVVPPGSHTLKWRVSSPSPLAGFLDHFIWRPAAAGLSLAHAADAAGVTDWSTPDGQWFPIADPGLASDGVDAIAVASLPFDEKCVMDARCTGPGTLRYWIKKPAMEYGYLGHVNLSVNGLDYPAGAVSNASDWVERQVYLAGNDPHQLQWIATGGGSALLHAFFLDQASFTPATAGPTLAVALDQPGWTFRTGGLRPWLGATTPAGRGGHLSAVTMLPTDPAEGSWIETTITGPGFLIPVMTSPSQTYIGWSMDGNTTINSGNQGFAVPAGSHTLRWTAYQSGSTPAGPQNVTFTLDALDWYPGTWTGWQQHRFNGTGTSTALQQPSADPDADGFSNMMEAVLGTHPLQADAAPPLELMAGFSSSQRYLQFRCAPAFPAELSASLETAPSLTGPWSTLSQANPQNGSWGYPFYSEALSGGTGRSLVTGSQNFYSQEGTKFWRIKVVKP